MKDQPDFETGDRVIIENTDASLPYNISPRLLENRNVGTVGIVDGYVQIHQPNCDGWCYNIRLENEPTKIAIVMESEITAHAEWQQNNDKQKVHGWLDRAI